MNRIFDFLTAFATLAVVFSTLTGCGPTGQNTGTTDLATNTGVQKQTSATEYPPLPAALADAEVAMLDGTKFKLSDKKGKVLLVNIWGTWCGPCIQEMPHLIALQSEYGEKGFEVIGMNIGDGNGEPEPIDRIKAFVEKQKLNYTVAIASNTVNNQFNLITQRSVVPQTILVDREGHLRGVFVGGGQRIFDSLKQNVAKVVGES